MPTAYKSGQRKQELGSLIVYRPTEDLRHPFPHDEPLARGQGDHGIGAFFYVPDQFRVEEEFLAAQACELDHRCLSFGPFKEKTGAFLLRPQPGSL